MSITKGSKGGKVRGILEREEALANYYLKPNYCLQCYKVIKVPDHRKVKDIRRKKFCNRSCAAIYNNSHYPKRHCTQSTTGVCQTCGITIYYLKRSDGKGYSVRRYCDRCRAIRKINGRMLVDETMKGELFARTKNWQSARTIIRYNAKVSYMKSSKPLLCNMCGYDKHVNIAHIKGVSEFSDSTLISVINHPDNLVALCPNHHWEYDHNYPD